MSNNPTTEEVSNAQTNSSSNKTILQADDLEVHFPNEKGFLSKLFRGQSWVKAVDGIDLSLRKGETFGLAGESGCGKSTLGKALVRIHEPTGGKLYFNGEDITHKSEDSLKYMRKKVQFIFQDPQSSLNPRQKVGDIIGEPMEIHNLASGDEKREYVDNLLQTVGLSEEHRDRYPHEFSRGQQQRIGIARALAVNPDVLVADEPVSALDMSVQAKILNLLTQIQEELNLTMLFIAHDLEVVRHISDRVGIMYLGEFAEKGPVDEVFEPPYHPYTESLLSSVPVQYPDKEKDRIVLEGTPPSPINPPSGCKFHNRCPRKIGEVCEKKAPRSVDTGSNSDHAIKCHLFDDNEPGSWEESIGTTDSRN